MELIYSHLVNHPLPPGPPPGPAPPQQPPPPPPGPAPQQPPPPQQGPPQGAPSPPTAGPLGHQPGAGPPGALPTQGNKGDKDDDDDDNQHQEEENRDEEYNDGNEDDNSEMSSEEYDDQVEQDYNYDDDEDNSDEEQDGEEDYGDKYTVVIHHQPQYDPADDQYAIDNSQPNRGQKRKHADSVEDEDESVEKIVEVPSEYQVEEIAEEEAPVDPELFTPQPSHVQDTLPRPRHSPRKNKPEVTEEIPPTPLQFSDPGTQGKAARIETPQNPSTKQNQQISRQLILHSPLGPNPQPSTSTGTSDPKTVPAKSHHKTGKHGHGCGRGCGRGTPPTAGPTPGVGAGVPGGGSPGDASGVGAGANDGGSGGAHARRGGRGGGVDPGAAPNPNIWYNFRSPLVIVEVQGKKVGWDHNIYSSKAFCEVAAGLAFAPQGYIIHVFPDRVDTVSAYHDRSDMTVKCEAEHFNLQQNGVNLVAAFQSLTEPLVQILVKQMMTTASITTNSFEEKQALGLNYYSDAKKRHGPACFNCYHCDQLHNIWATNQILGVRNTAFEPF